MRPVRSIPYVLLLTLLVISTTVDVRAQSATTSISKLNAPRSVLMGKDVPVSFTVTYTKGYNGYYLGIAIFDRDTQDYVQGIAYASPTNCMSSYMNTAFCFMSPLQSSGSIDVGFSLGFYAAKSYSLEAVALLEDSSANAIDSSWSRQDFSILVTDKVQLTVRAQDPVSLTVDGIQQNPGNVFLQVYPGLHSISAPATVDVNPGERLRFDHWSDGSTGSTKSVDLRDDASYSAIYVTQYALTLVTSQGSATGQDWYDAGTVAKFSVPSSVPMDGNLGSLGAKYDFQGWYEGKTLVASSNEGSLTMNSSHTLTASWTPNYTIPILLLLLIAAAIITILATLLLLVRHKHHAILEKPEVSPPEQSTVTSVPAKEPVTLPAKEAVQTAEAVAVPEKELTAERIAVRKKETMYCKECGAQIPRNSKFCVECGAKAN